MQLTTSAWGTAQTASTSDKGSYPFTHRTMAVHGLIHIPEGVSPWIGSSMGVSPSNTVENLSPLSLSLPPCLHWKDKEAPAHIHSRVGMLMTTDL